jgi:hypothetical protein
LYALNSVSNEANMVLSPDQQRIKALLTETMILLCKNGLHFKTEFSIEGLIGITLDQNDVFLIGIKETINAETTSVQAKTHAACRSPPRIRSVNTVDKTNLNLVPDVESKSLTVADEQENREFKEDSTSDQVALVGSREQNEPRMDETTARKRHAESVDDIEYKVSPAACNVNAESLDASCGSGFQDWNESEQCQNAQSPQDRTPSRKRRRSQHSDDTSSRGTAPVEYAPVSVPVSANILLNMLVRCQGREGAKMILSGYKKRLRPFIEPLYTARFSYNQALG